MGNLRRQMDLEEAVGWEYLRGFGEDQVYSNVGEEPLDRYAAVPKKQVLYIPPKAPAPKPLPALAVPPKPPIAPKIKGLTPLQASRWPAVQAVPTQQMPTPLPKAEVVEIPEETPVAPVKLPEAGPVAYAAPPTNMLVSEQMMLAPAARPLTEDERVLRMMPSAALRPFPAEVGTGERRATYTLADSIPAVERNVANAIDEVYSNLSAAYEALGGKVPESAWAEDKAAYVKQPETLPKAVKTSSAMRSVAEVVGELRKMSWTGKYETYAGLMQAVQRERPKTVEFLRAMGLSDRAAQVVKGVLEGSSFAMSVNDFDKIIGPVAEQYLQTMSMNINPALPYPDAIRAGLLVGVVRSAPLEFGVAAANFVAATLTGKEFTQLEKKQVADILTETANDASTRDARLHDMLATKILRDTRGIFSQDELLPPPGAVGMTYAFNPEEGSVNPSEKLAYQAYKRATSPAERLFAKGMNLQRFSERAQALSKSKDGLTKQYLWLKYGARLWAAYSGANRSPSERDNWHAIDRYEAMRDLQATWNLAMKDAMAKAFDKKAMAVEVRQLQAASATASKVEAQARFDARLQGLGQFAWVRNLG